MAATEPYWTTEKWITILRNSKAVMWRQWFRKPLNFVSAVKIWDICLCQVKKTVYKVHRTGKRGKFDMVMNIELKDINREEYNQNLQKKKAYYYKKDGNTVACGYKNMCPLEIITCSETHKGLYLEIQNGEIYNIWAEIEGVIFKSCVYSGWDTLEKLNKNLTCMGKEEFLKLLETFEKKHGYIRQLYITVVKALGYIDLAGIMRNICA